MSAPPHAKRSGNGNGRGDAAAQRAALAVLPELPAAMAGRFQRNDGLPADDAALMTQSLDFARYYEAVRDGCDEPKLAANWLMGEVAKRLNTEGLEIKSIGRTAFINIIEHQFKQS